MSDDLVVEGPQAMVAGNYQAWIEIGSTRISADVRASDGGHYHSVEVPRQRVHRNVWQDPVCGEIGCAEVIRATRVGESYVRLQHGPNPEHTRTFILGFLSFPTEAAPTERGYLMVSLPRKNELFSSWLVDLHRYQDSMGYARLR